MVNRIPLHHSLSFLSTHHPDMAEILLKSLPSILKIGTLKTMNFPFVPNRKLMVSGVPILKNIRVPYFSGYKTELFPSKTIPKI